MTYIYYGPLYYHHAAVYTVAKSQYLKDQQPECFFESNIN